MSFTLETERLALRPLTPEDHEGFHAIWGDPEVIWWGAHGNAEETAAGLQRVIDRTRDCPPGVAWHAIRRRGEEEILGDVVLQPAPFIEGLEVGWHLRRDAWGHGYATEAARGLIGHVFAAGLAERLYAAVAHTNEPSLRVVDRLGMRYVKDITHGGLPHRLFVIDRPAG